MSLQVTESLEGAFRPPNIYESAAVKARQAMRS